MKRTIILFLLCVAALAACKDDEPAKPNYAKTYGLILDYPYIWAKPLMSDTADRARCLRFNTYDYSLPLFDNGQKVIVGNINGGITCLETENGNEVWTCRILDSPEEASSKAILDFIIASTEDWMVINVDSIDFIKIDLRTGNILGRCKSHTKTSARMIQDEDECFYLTIKEQVYRVTISNMEYKPFSFNGVFISNIKYFPFPCVHNNEKYYFVMKSDKNNVWDRSIDSLYLINSAGNMIYKTLLKRPWGKITDCLPITSIVEYNNETYLFRINDNSALGVIIFNWDSMRVVYDSSQLVISTARYYSFIHNMINMIEFYATSIYNYTEDYEIEEDEICRFYIDYKSFGGGFDKGNQRGRFQYEDIEYFLKDQYFIARKWGLTPDRDVKIWTPLVDCNSNAKVIDAEQFEQVHDIETGMAFYTMLSYKTNAYPRTIAKNAVGNSVIVFMSEDMVFCFPVFKE